MPIRRLKHLLYRVKQSLVPTKPVLGPGPGLAPDAWRLSIDRLQEMSARFRDAPCRPGHCNVCGEATAFFCKNEALARESYNCASCRTTSRYRSMARGVLQHIERSRGIRADSLKALQQHRFDPPLRIYDAQLPFYFATCAYPLPDLLAEVEGIEVQVSRFRSKDPLGSDVRLARGNAQASNQNLEKLTFPDAHFDLVLTSDVMEHVRQDDLAHREIRRVLKPGGAYLFTVPHSRGLEETMHRVVVHDPSDPTKDEFVMEPEYHGDANDPENAALSFRVYGKDLDETLKGLGFEVDYEFFDVSPNGVVNTELFTCRVPE